MSEQYSFLVFINIVYFFTIRSVMLKMKIFIALIWWLFFGAALCLGVLEHSSDAKEQELTETGSEGRVSRSCWTYFF